MSRPLLLRRRDAILSAGKAKLNREMPQVNQLRVVVASPSDVKTERKSVESVAEELQLTTAKFLGLTWW